MLPGFALWMIVGGCLPTVLVEHAAPMVLQSSVPHLIGLMFAVSYSALMTGTCRLVQFFLMKRSRWGFTRLIVGQMGIALLMLIPMGFRFGW